MCAADKGSGFLRNVAKCLRYYTAWHLRRLSTYSPPWGLKRTKAMSSAFILMPTEVILIKFRYASLKWLWKTAGVSPTILGFWIVYHKSTTAFTTFVNLELNLCSATTKGGAVSAVVKFMPLQLAALQESTVLSPRFLFLLLDILVYLNPPNGIL